MPPKRKLPEVIKTICKNYEELQSNYKNLMIEYINKEYINRDIDESKKRIYIAIIDKLFFLSSNCDEIIKKKEGIHIYRATTEAQLEFKFPIGLSTSKSLIEPIYFSTKPEYVKPYCLTGFSIYEYLLSDIYVNNVENQTRYHLFVDFSLNTDRSKLDTDFLQQLYKYVIETNQLKNKNNLIKVNNQDLQLGISKVPENQYLSIFGCNTSKYNNINKLGKRCSIHGIDKLVAIEFNKLFKELEEMLNVLSNDNKLNKQIRILGYYHGKVPNIDPQYSNFHPEIMIQSRFLMDNPEERDKIFALDVKTLRC
jgi:hypothetical protein